MFCMLRLMSLNMTVTNSNPMSSRPALQDPLARLRAERASLDRLRNVEDDLSTVENRYWKQIEYGDVDADERHEQQQRLDSPASRLNRHLRDRDWSAEVSHADAVRKSAQRGENLPAVLDRQATRRRERLGHRDRRERCARASCRSFPALLSLTRARIENDLGRRGHSYVERLPVPHDSQHDGTPRRRADAVEERLPPLERPAIERGDAVPCLDSGKSRRLIRE